MKGTSRQKNEVDNILDRVSLPGLQNKTVLLFNRDRFGRSIYKSFNQNILDSVKLFNCLQEYSSNSIDFNLGRFEIVKLKRESHDHSLK